MPLFAIIDYTAGLTFIFVCSTGHITQDKLERVLAMLQGANNKALLMYANQSYQLHFHKLNTDTFCSQVPLYQAVFALSGVYPEHMIYQFSQQSYTIVLNEDFIFLYRYSNVDMRSQEAYEMAVQGRLGPEGRSVPILTGLRCSRFEPPNFTLGR